MKLNGIRDQEKSWWGGRFKTISSISEEGMSQDNMELPYREEVCRMVESSCCGMDGKSQEPPLEASIRRWRRLGWV